MENEIDGLPRCARNDEPVVVTVDGVAPAVVNVDPGAAGSKGTAIVEMQDGQVVGVRVMPERLPLPVPPGGWPADEFTGEAGHFVRDPFTGVRSRAAD